MALYQSTHTGPQIDEAIDKVSTIEQSVINNTEDITTIEETLGTLEGSIGDVATDLGTHTSDGTIHHTIEEIETSLVDVFEPKKGTDDNYVTDAEKVILGNTSGTNSGDETTSTIKSKLGITTLSGDNTGDQDLSGLQLKNLIFNNVGSSPWEVDATYAGYGYKSDLVTTGVTSSMFAEVTFGHTESISGNYSPIVVTGTDYVRIYSKVLTEITIPTIIVFK